MILIIDNGMFANVINKYLVSLNYKSVIINSSEINARSIDNLSIKAIIISNGNKENINNTARIIQSYIWKVPILGIGIGGIVLGLLFNAKICDSKIETLDPLKIIHDSRTIYSQLSSDLHSSKWCRYAISDQLFKKTDLEISATVDKEIIGFRHKNLAIEGVLFDLTSITCEEGKEIIKNFVTYYIK
ncbi:MAG: trpG [Haloplasmataceae bacterium]|jgi:para-aminobenzoate synthetase component 2|nr:trpG [Haloplasmataceae bacterium]